MIVDGGAVAGRYRLGRRIGSGAMGIVWEAHDEVLNRTVAAKQVLLQPGQTETEANDAKRRVMREGRIAARLQHPNAVSVFDVVDDGDGMPWLVMEYVPSKSLAALLREEGWMPPTEAARIGMHVASALAAAHAAGVVHRDVKPANVLLGSDGTVKITDFGISRAVGDGQITATGMLVGTPAYLAPEIAKGQEPTSASDVFSLAATLYFAVEGVPPFGLNDNPLALLHKVSSGEINPPTQAGPLTGLLLAMLGTEPSERLSMLKVRGAMSAIAYGRPDPVIAAPPARTATLPRNGAQTTKIETRPAEGVSTGPMPEAAAPAHRGAAQHGAAHHGPASHNAPGHNTASHGAASDETRRKRRTIGIAAAGIAGVAVIVGATVALLSGPGQQPSSAHRAAAPMSSIPHSRVTAPPLPAFTGQPSVAIQQQLVQNYLGLLPDNADVAWTLLDPNYRSTLSGESTWAATWQNCRSITVSNLHQESEYYFQADLLETKKDGSKVKQRMGFSVHWDGSTVLIASEKPIGSAQPQN